MHEFSITARMWSFFYQQFASLANIFSEEGEKREKTKFAPVMQVFLFLFFLFCRFADFACIFFILVAPLRHILLCTTRFPFSNASFLPVNVSIFFFCSHSQLLVLEFRSVLRLFVICCYTFVDWNVACV